MHFVVAPVKKDDNVKLEKKDNSYKEIIDAVNEQSCVLNTKVYNLCCEGGF